MRLRFLPLLALMVFVPACGSNAPIPGPSIDTGDALKELGDAYKYLATQRLAPPRKVEDFGELAGSLEGAVAKIQAGEVVVVWGTGYAASSNQVLAYAKEAPTSGGKVLLRNGTVKDMTADEFRAAKK